MRKLGLGASYRATGVVPSVLDVAGGTGDVSFRMLDELRAAAGDGGGDGDDGRPWVTVSDINGDMLRVGQERARARFGDDVKRVSFVEANAEALPFDDDSFDVYTIAFGLRNVTNTDNALSEARRILRRGGRLCVLEFSPVVEPWLQAVYDSYSLNAIPALGELTMNDRASYQYLVESIRAWHTPDELARRCRAAGLVDVGFESYSSGIVALHSGFVP